MKEAILNIKENNIIALQKRLEVIDINSLDEQNNSLLHYALMYHKYEISYYLINKGINLNVINIYGFTPISLAVKLNQLNIVTALIDNNANPFIYNSNLEDAIYLAYLYGRENIILYFENKFNYDNTKANKNGESILFALIKSHNYKLVTKYINKDNIYQIDNYNNTLLMCAVKIDDINIVSYLLSLTQMNINVFNNTRKTSIRYAIDNKNINMIKLLLNNGAFTNFYLKGIDYNNDILSLSDSLSFYDKTNLYSLKYKLIYYFIQNDLTMYSKYINYNNIYLKDIFNNNIYDYLNIFKINYKNKYYELIKPYIIKKK